MAINGINRSDVNLFRQALEDPETLNLINTYQRIAGNSAVYPGQGTPLGLAYVALKLNGEAGEFAEHVGKAMRDDDLIPIGEHPSGVNVANLYNKLTPERRTALIKEVGDVLWYCQAACRELGITMSEAALINLEKLCDRSERNKLQGSGDER